MSDVAAFEATLYPHLRNTANFCVGVPRNDADPDVRRRRRHDGLQRHHDAAEGESRRSRAVARVLAPVRRSPQLRRQRELRRDRGELAGRHPRVGAAAARDAAADAAVADELEDELRGRAPPGRRAPTATSSRSSTSTRARARRPWTRAASARRSRCRYTGMEWVDGGLRNVSGKAQANATDSRKLFDAISPAGAFTIEAWIAPANADADGTGAHRQLFERHRHEQLPDGAASGPLSVPQPHAPRAMPTAIRSSKRDADDVAAELQHVVMTFSPAAGRKTYVNGVLTAQETAPTTLAWQNNQTFVIGNETTQRSPLAGHVPDGRDSQQSAVGRRGAAELRGRHRRVRDAAVRRVERSSARRAESTCSRRSVDDASYVFAKPTFVGGATGVRVKNIRIAVNDTVPVAAQAFRRVDTTVLASGTELSRLGAVIPVAQGPDTDRFHLEFEQLGTRFGTAEAVAPSVAAARRARRARARARHAQLLARQRHDVGADGRAARQRCRRDVVRRRSATRCPRATTCSRFGSAQQVADPAARPSATAAQIVAVPATCNTFFATTNCAITAGTRTQIAGSVYDKLFGHEPREPTGSRRRVHGARRRHERPGLHGRLHGRDGAGRRCKRLAPPRYRAPR